MAIRAVQSFIEQNPMLLVDTQRRWPELSHMRIVPEPGPSRPHVDAAWCRHTFAISDWQRSAERYVLFRALALRALLVREDPVACLPEAWSEVAGARWRHRITVWIATPVTPSPEPVAVGEREAEDRDVTPAAFTKMRLSDAEAASLDDWFDHAAPHPADPRAKLPRRGELASDEGAG